MSCIKIIITKVKIKNEYYIIFIRVSNKKSILLNSKYWDGIAKYSKEKCAKFILRKKVVKDL